MPYILGIAHPTGFPAFTLAGWLFSHALAFGTVAWRLNVFSGVWIAIATGGLVLLAHALGAGAPEAVVAALAFAVGREAWYQGTHADVHAMLLAFVVFALVFALRYLRDGRRRDIVSAALCTGLGLATHPLALFVLPALVIALGVQRTSLRDHALPAAAALAVPLLLYLYFPVRSAYVAAHGLDPTAAAPLFGAGTIAWDTEHPRTLAGFIAETTGRQFDASQHLATSFAPQHYVSDVRTLWRFVPSELPVWLLPFAALGLVAAARPRPAAAAAVLALSLGAAAFAGSVFTESQDLARYLLLPFAAAIVFAAAAAQLPIPGVPLAVRRLVVVLALAAAVATGALRNAPHDDHRGRLAIDTVRAAVPDGSLVVASWADATALAYASFVEHSLGTRIVVLGWPSDFTGDYPSWTRTRRVIVFAGFYGMLDLERRPLLRVWMHALPSPTPNYQIVEIRP